MHWNSHWKNIKPSKIKEIKKINFENYKLNKIPSLKDIIEEILNYKAHHINKSVSKISYDYDTAIDFQFALRAWCQQILKFMNGAHSASLDDAEIYNKNILSLSNMEKNIILLTFILQLVVFIIIQFFEVNSIDYNLRIRKKWEEV